MDGTGVLDFSRVERARVYTTAQVAGLFAVDESTVRRWCEGGKLRFLVRLGPRSPYRVLGTEILRLLGDQVESVFPVETTRERAERAAKARQRIHDLKQSRRDHSRPGGVKSG